MAILDLDADFDDKERGVDAVERLLETVEHYRDKGKSLASIHRVLLKRGELTMGYQSFANYYYAQRKLSEPSAKDESELHTIEPALTTLIREKSKRYKQKPVSVPKQKIRQIDIENTDMEAYIAAHQAQAKAYFNRQ